MGNRSKRKTVIKSYRRIHGFDMNTAAGREAAKQYRMEKYRIKKGLISGEPALPKRRRGEKYGSQGQAAKVVKCGLCGHEVF